MGERRRRGVLRCRPAATALATALVAASLAGGPAAGAADPERREAAPTATRVLVVGDSITQATVGDYSWRYFAWKHLQSVGAPVDLVGPKREPYVGPGAPWKAVYADANFDQDHAGTWGDQMTTPLHNRDKLMSDYRPDVVVVELGVNDMLWRQATAETTVELMRAWVTAARARVPQADFVLVEAPWTNNAVAMTYNWYLETLATQLDTPASRVVLARSTPGYQMGRKNGSGDTYDMLHPNTRGQVKIAAAVTDALATLGVGKSYARPLRVPAEGPRVVPVLRGRSTSTSARWRWSLPPGATSFDVWVRRPGKRWVRAVRAHPGTSYRLKGLKECAPHQLRVLARKGWTLAGKDVTSPVVTTRVGPKVHGRPGLRKVGARARGVRASWSSVPGACTYGLRAKYRVPGDSRVRTRVLQAASTRAVMRGLPSGSTVKLQVRGVGARNATRWSTARIVKVPG